MWENNQMACLDVQSWTCDSRRLLSIFNRARCEDNVLLFLSVCEHFTAFKSYRVLYKWDGEKEWKIKSQNMTMTSFERALPSTKMLPLETCSVFASVTLQEKGKKKRKTWEPAENTTQRQKDWHQTEHRATDTCQQIKQAHKHKQYKHRYWITRCSFTSPLTDTLNR